MGKKGFVSFFIVFFILIFVIGTSIFTDAGNYRSALAEDMKSGILDLNNQAAQMIAKGDKFLEDAGRLSENPRLELRNMSIYDNDLIRAFIAKVWFERARLEMETQR
jgi:hypothetical protein